MSIFINLSMKIELVKVTEKVKNIYLYMTYVECVTLRMTNVAHSNVHPFNLPIVYTCICFQGHEHILC